MPVIQTTTIGGKIIEKARWEVDTLVNIREGHTLQISLAVEDNRLIGFLGKRAATMDCVLEKEGDSHYVVLSVRVMRFRHMLEGKSDEKGAPAKFDSMVMVVPVNRTVEEVMTYLLDPEKCNPRFSEALRKPSSV